MHGIFLHLERATSTLINKLDKANNDAPLSLEIEFTAKGPKDLDEINTAVKESAVYLKNLGYKI